MSVGFVEVPLPDSPYEMWIRGDLERYLGLPEGFRAEIIEGDIVVSPAPRFAHNWFATSIIAAMARAADADPTFRWVAIAGTGVGEPEARGWIPDVAIMDRVRASEALAADEAVITPLRPWPWPSRSPRRRTPTTTASQALSIGGGTGTGS